MDLVKKHNHLSLPIQGTCAHVTSRKTQMLNVKLMLIELLQASQRINTFLLEAQNFIGQYCFTSTLFSPHPYPL